MITVIAYDPSWPLRFAELRDRLWAVVDGHASAIEHVGSTAVPGLAAKPIIDVDIIVDSADQVPAVIRCLEAIGYRHQGDLGIPGREAFIAPQGAVAHHLYVCPRDALALRNHLAIRDHLRADADSARRYGELKMGLAATYRDDSAGYTTAKTEFLLAILKAQGFPVAALATISALNRPGPAA